ncbi:MAG TPA: hypothetical protein VFR47_29625 [Anaerolineales bacterium]|nr:hypothetical protein [Anaerolineales bacterium]
MMKIHTSFRLLFTLLAVVSLILLSPSGASLAHAPNHQAGKGPDGASSKAIDPDPALVRAHGLILHDRNMKRLQAQGSPQSQAESMDIDVDGDGTLDLAVLVDNGAMIIPPQAGNLLDLQPGMRIRYTPTGTDTFHVELALGQSLDPGLGSALTLTDDSFAQVAITAPFSFLGTTYNEIFVGSDGHITFGEGDGTSNARDAARHIGGPPRLSALLTDLNPECGGAVYVDVRADRTVVTWNQVIHFVRGAIDGCGANIPTNTLQAVLYADGSVDFVYGTLDLALLADPVNGAESVTGIAEGNAEGPFNEIDMTAGLPADFTAGAIFEEFGPTTLETFDIVQVALEFYRSHPDHFDYLTMFTDFDIFGFGALAFSAGVKNETLGLGLDAYDFSEIFGSAGELENFLWMNNIYLWYGNSVDTYINPPIHEPVPTFPYEQFGFLDITGSGRSSYTHHGRAFLHFNPNTWEGAPFGFLAYDLNSPISVMFQEADHRWAAFTPFVHPTKGLAFPDIYDLLGRQFAHWSTFFNATVLDSPFTQLDGMPRLSGMEGNALIELDMNASGQIVDKNNPSRVFADPRGKLRNAFNACANQGKGLFLTEPDQLTDGSTDLDQYLMGVRLSQDVRPFWYVDEPSSALDGSSLDDPFPTEFFRSTLFQNDDLGFCGIRVDLTIDNITDVGALTGIPIYGPRVPAIGDENDIGPREACLSENLGGAYGPCADVKTMAFLLVVKTGPPNSPAHMAAIQRLNEFRLAWQFYTDGPGLAGRNADGVVRPSSDPDFIPKFDTSLEPDIH